MAAPQLYPLSTQDGKHIPLDVVKPLGLTAFTMTANTAADITVPVGYSLVWLYATAACVLHMTAVNLPNALVSGTNYTDSIFIPADTLMTIVVEEGECSLLGLGAGTLYMNSVEQWAALVQPLQSSVG